MIAEQALIWEKLSRLDQSLFQTECENLIDVLTINQLAHLFVDAAYMTHAMEFIKGEYWLENKNSEAIVIFKHFINKHCNYELQPILLLQSFLESSNLHSLQQIGINAESLKKNIVSTIKKKTKTEQKAFAQVSLKLMSELFKFENNLNFDKKIRNQDLGLSMYRTFDIFDDLLDLHYITDEKASEDTKKERLYEGAGLGVQSSYATTLNTIRYLNPKSGTRFVDLGSGYGRVGLVLGLLRPDVQFTGYEFVEDRVQIANDSVDRFNLDQHVHFYAQDLSASDFKIPEAEFYYIFDSFTDETYKYVIDQLIQISQIQKIKVITKGNARMWLQNSSWVKVHEFNDGNMCIFESVYN